MSTHNPMPPVAEPASPGYPLLLRLDSRRCVVVGGGTVALRKVRGLLDCGASITVISPQLAPELAALAQTGRIEVEPIPYATDLLPSLQPFLVFAATDSPEINRLVATDARAIGALVDTVDDASGDFSTMAVTRRGPLTIALGSGGVSPALVAHLRAQLGDVINDLIGPEYVTLAEWIAEARSRVKQELDTQTRRADLWQALIASSVLADLRAGNEAAARATFDRLIADAMTDPSVRTTQ